MPFSKYIAHEHIEAMQAAFHKVCDALLLNGDVDDPVTSSSTKSSPWRRPASMTPTG
jgi:hypothetical protein